MSALGAGEPGDPNFRMGAGERSRPSDGAGGPGDDSPGSGGGSDGGPGHDWPASDGGPDGGSDHVPLAYLITFTTYATWLHGDERGSVDRQHNVPDTPYLAPNPRRAEWERGRARQAPVTLDAGDRALVAAAIVEVCV